MPTYHIPSINANYLLVISKSYRAQFVRLLDLGLILRWTEFPGFREAFGPGEIEWDIDAGPFLQDMDGIEGGAFTTETLVSLACVEHVLCIFERLQQSCIELLFFALSCLRFQQM